MHVECAVPHIADSHAQHAVLVCSVYKIQTILHSCSVDLTKCVKKSWQSWWSFHHSTQHAEAPTISKKWCRVRVELAKLSRPCTLPCGISSIQHIVHRKHAWYLTAAKAWFVTWLAANLHLPLSHTRDGGPRVRRLLTVKSRQDHLYIYTQQACKHSSTAYM